MRAVLLLLAFCCTSQALDITLENGTSYTNIRLREKTPLGIRVQHDAGLSFFDYLSLTEADRMTFGYEVTTYDAAKAKLGQPAAALPVTSRPSPTPILNSAATTTSSRGFTPKYVAPAATPAPVESPSRTSSYSGRCIATTKKGYQCSRSAQSGRSYCWQHP